MAVLDRVCSNWRQSLSNSDSNSREDGLGAVRSTWLRYILIAKGFILHQLKFVLNSLKYGFANCFPYLKASYFIAIAVNKMFYLMNLTDFHDPMFSLLGIHLSRGSPSGGTNSSNPRIFNMSNTAFIIFLTRLVQWYHNSDLSAHNIANVFKASVRLPPCPRPLEVGSGCVLPPQDKGTCPICREVTVHPCAASSGYVFCYSCILPVIRRTERCPVTDTFCSEQQLVRLFENNS